MSTQDTTLMYCIVPVPLVTAERVRDDELVAALQREGSALGLFWKSYTVMTEGQIHDAEGELVWQCPDDEVMFRVGFEVPQNVITGAADATEVNRICGKAAVKAFKSLEPS